jgi:hypothetical protein
MVIILDIIHNPVFYLKQCLQVFCLKRRLEEWILFPSSGGAAELSPISLPGDRLA